MGDVDENNTKWMSRFEELKIHRVKNGHFKVNRKLNSRLEQWIWYQKRRKNILLPERRNLLDSIGFFDEVGSVATSTDTEVKGKRKSTEVSSVATSNNSKKTTCRKGKFASDDARWMSRLQQLKDYRVNHGTFEVDRKDDKTLHNWIWRQKKYLNTNEISKKRRDLLESIECFSQNEPEAAAQSSQTLFDLTISDQDEKTSKQKPRQRTSLIGRTLFLEDAVGLTPKPNHNLCNRVTLLEKELFAEVKTGTITERIHSLEKEVE